MTCQSSGRYPIGTMGFGMVSEYSRIRVPRPPQNRTTFMEGISVRDSGDGNHNRPRLAEQPLRTLRKRTRGGVGASVHGGGAEMVVEDFFEPRFSAEMAVLLCAQTVRQAVGR